MYDDDGGNGGNEATAAKSKQYYDLQSEFAYASAVRTVRVKLRSVSSELFFVREMKLRS